MTIAYQPVMERVAPPPRGPVGSPPGDAIGSPPRRRGSLRIAPRRKPVRTVTKIVALLAFTALGAAVAAGTVAVAMLLVTANMGT